MVRCLVQACFRHRVTGCLDHLRHSDRWHNVEWLLIRMLDFPEHLPISVALNLFTFKLIFSIKYFTQAFSLFSLPPISNFLIILRHCLLLT